MAAESFVRAAEDELACPICFESFTDPNTPKTLPLCGHVLCEVCLNDMAAGKCANKECPECRKSVIFSKDGAASFPTNYRLRNLAEKHQKVGDRQGLRVGPTAQPSSEEKANGKMGGVAKALGDRSCPAHAGEELDFYCTPCDMLACQICVIQKHIGNMHKCEKAKDKYDEQKGEMQVKISEISQTIQQAKDERQKLKILLKETQDCNDTAEKQIDEQIEVAITKLHEEGKRLKNQLRSNVSDFEQTLAQVDQEILSAETTHQCAVQSLRNDQDCKHGKTVTQRTYLVDQMNQLGLKEYMSQIRATPYTAAKYVKSLARDIGRIVSVMPGKAREIELMQTINGFEGAHRITSSQNGLLLTVSDYAAKKVIIYRKASNGQYEKSHSLNLRTSNRWQPIDVVICSDGRFLVARYACIEVFNPEGVYLKSITTTDNTGTDVGVYSMITNSNGRIIAGDAGGNVITEHNPTGNIVRTIKTNIRPVYLTLIHDTHIAMSDSESGKVIVMDMQSEEETLSIDIPEVQGICYDEQTECLLTVRNMTGAKRGNLLPETGVIEQYCSTTGRLVACLEQGLYQPQGIRFLSDGNLAVADCQGVKIYKIE